MGISKKQREHIGELLKRARMKLKLKAEDVGAYCNVSRSRVYQWEAGDYVFPKNLPTLASVLKLSIKRLNACNGRPH